jgi:hypothetical protein
MTADAARELGVSWGVAARVRGGTSRQLIARVAKL